MNNQNKELLNELAKKFTERKKEIPWTDLALIASVLIALASLISLSLSACADIKEIDNNGDKIKVVTNCPNPYQCLRKAPKVFQKRESATWG
jgi:hypothetical protein